LVQSLSDDDHTGAGYIQSFGILGYAGIYQGHDSAGFLAFSAVYETWIPYRKHHELWHLCFVDKICARYCNGVTSACVLKPSISKTVINSRCELGSMSKYSRPPE